MADNYLEKKMEDYKSQASKGGPKGGAHSLGKLLLKNRSYRGYDNSFVVRADQLRRIIEVNTRTPSARNQQVLRFRPVTSEEAHKVLPHFRLGGALPNHHLPHEGEEPRAFIVVCTTSPNPDHYVYIDLGIAAQSMLLQAVEIGLGGICIGAFDKAAVKQSLELELEPLLLIAIGKPNEKIKLVEIGPEESHNYWRDDEGTHYVPKISVEELTIERGE
ncbi:MAG: nitroreductase family protein [Tidjanibacter sp.]|nr:nitroreductase family protein [Tidjanibacter sp.]